MTMEFTPHMNKICFLCCVSNSYLNNMLNNLKLKSLAMLKNKFSGSDKNPYDQPMALILQECKVFHSTPIDAHVCGQLITKLLYSLGKENKVEGEDLTKLFFGITKLFQAKSPKLRRLVFTILKHLKPEINEVFIITSSLMKDMQSQYDCYKANAIKVLAMLLYDANSVSQLEKYLRQSLNDRSLFVSSSALLAASVLLPSAPETVKRWVGDTQDSLSSNDINSFHALILNAMAKKSDKISYHKLITQLIGMTGSTRNCYYETTLIRLVGELLVSDPNNKQFAYHLEFCLRNKNEAIAFEAARIICIYGVNVMDIGNAVTVLGILLSSSKTPVRFGAARALANLASIKPQSVARCNSDLENLLGDNNKNIGVLALTCLLKTSSEQSLDRLVGLIQQFFADVGETFKIDIVKAVISLIKQFPGKQQSMLSFFASNLREEGSIQLKKLLVDGLCLVASDPKNRDSSLLQLCEFIEDCDSEKLASEILVFLGEEIPKTADPSKYIRFIYNRIILESALIRMSAVECLMAIHQKIPGMKETVSVLLKSVSADPDDEVRERIAIYLEQIDHPVSTVADEDDYLNIDALYDALADKLANGDKNTEIDYSSLPTKSATVAAAYHREPSMSEEGTSFVTSVDLLSPVYELIPADQLGECLIRITDGLKLTDDESEYLVRMNKFIFNDYLLLDFEIENTVENITLTELSIKLSNFDGNLWYEVGQISINSLEFKEIKHNMILLQRRHPITTGNFNASLEFTINQHGTNKYKDKYPINAIKITPNHYMMPLNDTGDKETGEEVSVKTNLPIKSLSGGVEYFKNIFPIRVIEGSDDNIIEGPNKTHTLLMAGKFLNGDLFWVKILMGVDPVKNLLVKISIKAQSTEISSLALKSLGII
jgi:coatomer subunit gamma